MSLVQVDLAEDVVTLLQASDRPVEETARELIVLELYRRGKTSSGRAAELLNMERFTFIRQASSQGIPYFDMTREELHEELERVRTLWPAHE